MDKGIDIRQLLKTGRNAERRMIASSGKGADGLVARGVMGSMELNPEILKTSATIDCMEQNASVAAAAYSP